LPTHWVCWTDWIDGHAAHDPVDPITTLGPHTGIAVALAHVEDFSRVWIVWPYMPAAHATLRWPSGAVDGRHVPIGAQEFPVMVFAPTTALPPTHVVS
jgi:hypothetical protein